MTFSLSFNILAFSTDVSCIIFIISADALIMIGKLGLWAGPGLY